MTKKLYDEDAYQTKFKAKVISCTPYKDGYDVILNQTLFFPEEGGQTCDQGTINDSTVLDVQMKEGIIHHYVSLPLQGEVEGEIDFLHRYNNMQNHSGEHVISGIVKVLFGFNNNGFHLSNHEITTDYDGILNRDQLDQIEEKANQIILENHPIHCFYPANPQDYDYRSKKEINEAIRLVEIEDVDCCACCAPHVKSTGEIGVIKILKAIKNKKGTRIFFVCGNRAYHDYKLKHNQAMDISQKLSLPPTELIMGIDRLINENNMFKQEISSLKNQMIDQHIQSLSLKDQHIIFIDQLEKSLQQYYINQLMNYARDIAAIFVGKQDHYQFMMVGNSAKETLTKLKNSFDVKGGGKEIIQGQIIASKQQIESCIKK